MMLNEEHCFGKTIQFAVIVIMYIIEQFLVASVNE